MMIGAYHHLRNARYLGSITILSFGELGSLGTCKIHIVGSILFIPTTSPDSMLQCFISCIQTIKVVFWWKVHRWFRPQKWTFLKKPLKFKNITLNCWYQRLIQNKKGNLPTKHFKLTDFEATSGFCWQTNPTHQLFFLESPNSKRCHLKRSVIDWPKLCSNYFSFPPTHSIEDIFSIFWYLYFGSKTNQHKPTKNPTKITNKNTSQPWNLQFFERKSC